ncbi:MAG: hypothetical protein ACI8XM_002277, partial [Haloarculaceae archaeon]
SSKSGTRHIEPGDSYHWRCAHLSQPLSNIENNNWQEKHKYEA